MKTIKTASLENSKQHYIMAFSEQLHKDADIDFRSGVKFAQEWISVDDELPECNQADEDGILYSDCILIKSNNLEFPVTGVYILANDDEFFDTFSKFEILQEDITHWRPIEIK